MRRISDGSGALIGTMRYTPFGRIEHATGALAAMGYTGEPQDASSLVYLRARYYHPTLGRFLTPDSIVPNMLNGQDWNAYAYVRNNPVRWVDPSGHAVSTGSTDAPLVSCSPGAFADCVVNASLVMEQPEFITFLEDHAAEARRFTPNDGLLNPIVATLGESENTAAKYALYFNLGLWKMQDEQRCQRPPTWEPIALLGMGSVDGLGDSGMDLGEEIKGGGGTSISSQSNTERTWTFLNKKKARQAAQRGWADIDITDTIHNPVETRSTVNKASGNPATVYYRADGHYVVRDDISGEIFQLSARANPNWIDPFNERVRPR